MNNRSIHHTQYPIPSLIAHLDADSFFASVLQRKHPRLKGKPLLATGMGGGMVIAASYEAKACGVKTGMPLKEARACAPQRCICPQTSQKPYAPAAKSKR